MSHVDDGALHAYLDGDLTPVERARLEAHVAECAPCRTRLDEERALIERASGLLGLAQPPERAMPPLHQRRRPRLTWRLRVPIAWAASVALALGLGYYIGEERAPQAAPLAAARLEDSAAPAYYGFLSSQDRAAGPPAAPPASPPPAAAKTQTLERRSANQVAARNDAPVDSTVVRALLDSTSAASGVVAIRPQEALREAAPTPVPSDAVVTSRTLAAEVADERGRLVATQWQIIRPGPARDLLGADPVGIPGLAVRNIRRSPTGDVVLVEQAVDSTTVIQLFQQRMENDQVFRRLRQSDAARAAVPSAASRLGSAGTERLARFVGGLRVEIAGPLSTDSLNRLLEQVKPIKP
jgi:anti-sigma factor RsiW